MAEIFNNFLKNITQVNTESIIIPSGISGNNTSSFDSSSDNYNFRNENSYVQLHSLYISQIDDPNRINGENRYNPANFKSIDLYIKDIVNTQLKCYIAYDVRIIPGSPFYIEKNITLTPSQYLCGYCSNTAKDIDIFDNNNLVALNNNLNLHITASSVLFI